MSGSMLRLRFALPLLLLFPLAFFFPATRAEPAPAAGGDERPLQVLFFGDDDHHQPLERYRLFKEVAGRRGIQLTYEKRMEALTPETLAPYDVLLVYANHQTITPAQLAAVTGYVERGGGLMPVHCGSACFKKTAGYIDLVGGQIEGHGEGVFTARVVAPEHPAMRGYTPFETWDETYRHQRLSGDITILQRRDEEPWTWVRPQGRGRVFYTAHGHDERCWSQDAFHELLVRGIRWAAGRDDVSLGDLPALEYREPMLPARYRTPQPVPRVQEPLSPVESLKRVQVPVGWELALFAAEPDVVHPIAITWDARGRLWVVETLDYPNGLRTGDTGHDRLKICEDTDGDGRADRFTVFATGLSLATSAVHANGGVIVSDGPRMLFLQDTDGDDRADQRRVLFEGFKTHDTHAGVSNLRYGFDGWIYGTVGYAGFEGVVAGRPLKFDTGVFRFQPDGSALEFVGKTSNNTWGLGFTTQFDILGSTANRQPSWQLIGDGGPVHRADRGTRIYPITQDIQGSDGWDPPVEVLGDGRIRAKARHYTAAAGHGIATGSRLPESWRDRTAFVCEPTGHLVSLGRLTTENADFSASFEGGNLYASSDAWSAPVMAETGPDGAVWIADWYNIIVQHLRPGAPFEQTAVERGQGSGYLTPLRERPLGRIYRLFPRASAAPVPVSLDPTQPQTLVAGVGSPELFWRLQAQRLIVERGGRDLVAPLAAAATGGEQGVQALWALAGLGYFAEDSAAGLALLETLTRHPDAARRRTALALWPAGKACDFEVLEERDPFVVREWLLLAARMPADEALGQRLRDWHRRAQQLRAGEVLDRCFAAAAARHSTGFLLASLDTPPDPSVLKERIYPAAIRAFAANRSPQILARLESDSSPLAAALKDAVRDRVVAKKFTPAVSRLASGEGIYERTCAACHQRSGAGVDGAFPPLDGSARVTGSPEAVIRIVLHGLSGPVEPAGRPKVDSLMPPVAGLSDPEVAEVISYVRHAWSNDAAEISAAEVAKVRERDKDRSTPWTAAELR